MTSNPYGLLNLWQQGDVVTKLITVTLFSMSTLSWCVIILKSLKLNRLQRQAVIANESFWRAKNLDDGVKLFDVAIADNPFRQLAEEGMHAASQHHQHWENLQGTLNLSEWVMRSLRRGIENSTHYLQTGLPILASIGSTSPFVGLFGTVWGIYHALVGIGVSGQASIDKVAGPVGEALIMTAFGLAVAIPAVLGYNSLTQGNKKLLSHLRNFAHDLHTSLLTSARLRPQSPSVQAPVRSLVGAGLGGGV